MKSNVVMLLVASLLLSNSYMQGLGEDSVSRHRKSQYVDNTPAYGGNLVVALRSEPKTLNPVIANDVSSHEIIGQTTADLIHINEYTQLPEPCLAKSWKLSANRLRYILQLRHDVRFSDGVPFDADDVIFSFKVYFDLNSHAPQRDSLVVAQRPMTVQKLDKYTIAVLLARPYASAERLFDNVAILPRHLLERAYVEGRLATEWSMNTSPSQIAGLGAFRIKEYVPGQHLLLERNPYYWKKDPGGNRLPYLSHLTFLFVGNEAAQLLRFEAGEVDIVDRISADDYVTLQDKQVTNRIQLYDVGPSLDYTFLLFNLTSELPSRTDEGWRKQQWFKDVRFRAAISSAIDRAAITKIVYRGHGVPIWTHVTPGNQLWYDVSVPHPAVSLSYSKHLLRAAGFSWREKDGALIDAQGVSVEFSVIASTSSSEWVAIATMIQQDLRLLGITLQIVPLEFHSLLDRVLNTHNYESAVLGLGGGDVDPNSQMNVWLSSGDDHLWNPDQAHPMTPWEAEIDRLMEQQTYAVSHKERKRLYDRVQEIEAEDFPLIFLVSPNLLVGAKERVRNFKPVILDSHTLWNSEQLFVQDRPQVIKR